MAVVVASTVVAVDSTVVADTGKAVQFLIQRKAAAGSIPQPLCFASIRTDRYPRRLSACLVAS